MSTTIDERDFDFEAEKTLLHLETCLTELDDSMDVELSMGVLSIEFEQTAILYLFESFSKAYL